MKPTLFFIKRMALPGRRLGSALMRGDQLAALVKPDLRDHCNVRTVPFHAGLMSPKVLSRRIGQPISGSLAIFVKSAARDLRQAHVDHLRDKGIKVGLDFIDMPLSQIDTRLFDFFVSASLAGKVALEGKLAASGVVKPVFLVHHHADPRIAGRVTAETFRCAYLGMPENARIPPALRDKVTFLHAKTGLDFARVIPRLAEFPLHFAVRPMPNDWDERGFKPFTKGFTAAACGAAILVNRDADDAEQLLGDDYPFFVDGASDDAVTDAFQNAADSFGGPVWQKAVARVAGLTSVSAPDAIAHQVQDMIRACAVTHSQPSAAAQELEGER